MTPAGAGGSRTNARLTRLLVGLSVGVWAVFFMVTFLAYSLYHHYSLTREVTERLQVIAASVSTPAANAVYALDRDSMQAIAEGALVHLEIGRVTIRDAALDDVVVVVERDGLRLDGRFALPPVTIPLNTHRPVGAGVLEVVNDPRHFQDLYVGRLWTFVAAGVGASFLLITVLTVAINGVVVVPVVRLARAAAGVQAGSLGDGLSAPPRHRPLGELGDLDEALRGMAGRLSTYADDLAREVAGRTADLRREVEERKVAERRAVESDTRLRHFLQTSSDGIAILDGHLHVADLNLAFASYVDLPQQAVIGRSIGTLLGDEVEERLAGPDGAAAFVREIELVAKTGFRSLLVTFTPTDPSNSGQPGWFLIASDVTSLKLVQTELSDAKDAAETANRAKSAFLANMSHEIRTPLNGILGFAELLLHHPKDRLSPAQADRVERIVESGRGLLGIINDILDLSKIEANRVDLESIPVDLDELVADVTAMVLQKARQKGLKLVTRIDPAVPAFVAGDPVRIRQMLLNLVSNAVKFTTRGGVVIHLAMDGDVLVLAVADTGIGIAADKQDVIFDAFAQADESTTRQFGGTGLGLAITQRLAGLMGGSIALDSRVGEGSTFTLRLPVPAVAVAAEPAPLPGTALAVVVEDDDLAAAVADHGRAAGAAPCRFAATDMLQAAASMRASGGVLVFGPEWSDGEVAMLARSFAGGGGGGAAQPVVHLAADGGTPSVAPDGLAVTVGAWGLSRGGLRTALALATGLASPSTLQEAAADGLPDRPAPTVAEAQAAGRLILIVDDSAINRDVLAEQIARLGEACVVARDGRDGLAMLERYAVALVITDAHMPEMDGLAMTRALRARGVPVPVIVLSANAMKGHQDHCLEAGADLFLSKPIGIKDLARAIRRFLPVEAAVEGPPVAADTAGAGAPVEDAWCAAGVDPAVLHDSLGAEGDALARYIGRFVALADDLLAGIRAADDAESLRLASHKMKSSALAVGAVAVAEAVRRIEHGASLGSRAPTAEDAAALEAAVTALRRAVADRRSAVA